MYQLSVIVPFRCENSHSDFLFERLKDLCTNYLKHSEIEFIVVDSGSLPEYSSLCEKLCADTGCRYLFQNTRGETFSLGGCRDFGVEHAKGQAISFLDVDLRMPASFWDRVLVLMKSWGISQYKKSFLAIPCLYLTKEGAENFLTQDDNEDKYQQIYLEYLQGNNENVESFATCSSVMIVDRLHYLSVGGHDPKFKGHGYEDFELYHRLMVEENIIPRSHNYYKDTKTWTTFTYNGFRSQLSILARPALMMNLMVFHLWHPRPKQSSFYNPKKLQENRERIFKAFEAFDKNKEHPAPLVSAPSLYKNVIFFGKINTNSFNTLRSIFPLLGNITCVSELDFTNPRTKEVSDNFYEMLSVNNVDLVLFPNPYGNQARLAIYQWCRANNFPYLCYDRGALPDSWFFDSHGFNADSKSYTAVNYRRSLTEERKASTEDYIYRCINQLDALESQGARIGAEALLTQFGILGKKVLFVPLQRPSDTVIKYFSGDVERFERFVETIDRLAGVLKTYGWVTIIKKHPLETVMPGLSNVIVAPEHTHFLDLLEACDASALINSGVGVYSMMMDKLCYIFGETFYHISGVNVQVKSQQYADEDAIKALAHQIATANQEVDRKRVVKFIDYLIHDFYSFGRPNVVTRIEPDKSKRTLTTGIDFYQIRLGGKLLYNYEPLSRKALSTSAPLFERFGLDLHNKENAAAPSKPAAKAATPPAKPTAPAKPASVATKPATEQTNVQKPQASTLIPNEQMANVLSRKVSKLRQNPYGFFNDAKNPTLRKLRVLFEK